ncbi:hypothetical protein D9758_014699 [Tetrapyrgos nigripes]|uniref:Uncharacterized protein n=1 Tax=Tetrapyrgos nigripes TaxID=182062 RepID=A0A8H5FNV0_9AGAR|nr:hypothetical protein D9758_014699 [Tetrapyrgos nigripes]
MSGILDTNSMTPLPSRHLILFHCEKDYGEGHATRDSMSACYGVYWMMRVHVPSLQQTCGLTRRPAVYICNKYIIMLKSQWEASYLAMRSTGPLPQ